MIKKLGVTNRDDWRDRGNADRGYDDIRRQVKQLNKSRRLYSVQILKGEQIFLCVTEEFHLYL